MTVIPIVVMMDGYPGTNINVCHSFLNVLAEVYTYFRYFLIRRVCFALGYYGGTLVIAPASLLQQWEAEVKNRVKRGLLTVLIFHGNNRTVEDRKLSKYSIVITTYQIMVREAAVESSMYRVSKT